MELQELKNRIFKLKTEIRNLNLTGGSRQEIEKKWIELSIIINTMNPVVEWNSWKIVEVIEVQNFYKVSVKGYWVMSFKTKQAAEKNAKMGLLY